MEQNEFYEVNNFVVKITKDKYEVDKIYSDRVIYIIEELKKYKTYSEIKKKIDKYINLSRMYVNNKFLGCVY